MRKKIWRHDGRFFDCSNSFKSIRYLTYVLYLRIFVIQIGPNRGSHLKKATRMSDEEDESNCVADGDGPESDARRRRLCNERKQQISPDKEPPPRRPNIDTAPRSLGKFNKYPIKRRPRPFPTMKPPRRQPTSVGQKRPRLSETYRSTSKEPFVNQQSTIEPVIHINPKLIKKFIEKSIKLTSNPSNVASQSLKPAATMTIVRLVTECIEDDSKRDEKMNKVLVTRLLERLEQNGFTETHMPQEL